LQNAVSTYPETKPKVQTEIKAVTQTLTPVITKITPHIGRPRILVPSGDGKDEKRELTEEEIRGSVAWKQGWCYKLVYPPYGEKNIINTKDPIPGVKYHEGARSAYLSIVKINGTLPYQILRDMGIMDVTITTKDGKPRLKFTRDLKQTTKKSGRIRHKAKSKQSETQIVVSRLIG
jgi:hypothetical protein